VAADNTRYEGGVPLDGGGQVEWKSAGGDLWLVVTLGAESGHAQIVVGMDEDAAAELDVARRLAVNAARTAKRNRDAEGDA
jgi:hypothetical protein